MSLQNFENQIEPGLSILVEILEPQDQVVAGQQIVQLELLALANIKQLKKSHGSIGTIINIDIQCSLKYVHSSASLHRRS